MGSSEGKGKQEEWLREKEKRDRNIGGETKEEEPYLETQQAGAGAARYANMIPEDAAPLPPPWLPCSAWLPGPPAFTPPASLYRLSNTPQGF